MPPRPLVLSTTIAALLLGGPLLVPPPTTATSSHRELAYPDSRFERLSGIDVHHLVSGPAGGPTLLLSHHFYGSAPTWRKLAGALPDTWQVVAFDRPGFGLTERLERDRWGELNPYSRTMAARLGWQLLDHLDVEDAVLVGSSAGGTNVLEMYLLHPERVRAIVLLSPAITGDVGPPTTLRPLLRSPQVRAIAPHLIQRFVGEVDVARTAGSWADPTRATPTDAEPYQRMLQVDGWDRGFWEVINASPRPQLGEALGQIRVPVLVVSGDRDTVIRPHWNRRTAEAIPGARYAELSDCGHTPQEECPEALATMVERFLDQALSAG
jgi:pimeloyl-ACP methyl ester carboxylesterase